MGINPEKGTKTAKGKKRRTVNSHVASLLRKLMDFQWDFIWKWWVIYIYIYIYALHMFKQQWLRRLGKFILMFILNCLSKLEYWTPLPCSFAIIFFSLSINCTHHPFYYFMSSCIFCALFLKLAFVRSSHVISFWIKKLLKLWNSPPSLSLPLSLPLSHIQTQDFQNEDEEFH